MALILTLLFITPFLRERSSQVFLVLYTFVIFVAKDLRILLVELDLLSGGKEFFQFYSSVQFVVIVGTAILLTGWQRVVSILVFFIFSIYNISIYWFWGDVPIIYYDLITEVVILSQVAIVSAKERIFSKEGAWVMLVSIVVYHAASRYI